MVMLILIPHASGAVALSVRLMDNVLVSAVARIEGSVRSLIQAVDTVKSESMVSQLVTTWSMLHVRLIFIVQFWQL